MPRYIRTKATTHQRMSRADFARVPDRYSPEVEQTIARLRSLRVPERNIQAHIAGLIPASLPIEEPDVGRKRLSPEHVEIIRARRKGTKWSEATKAKISASKRAQADDPLYRALMSGMARKRYPSNKRFIEAGKTVFLGRRHSAQTKAKLSAIAKELWTDPEHRANHERSMTPQWRRKCTAHHVGRKRSEVTKARMSAALKRAHASNPVWIRSERA